MSAARVAGAGASLLIHAALFAQLLAVSVPAAESGVPVMTRPDSGDLDWRLIPTQIGDGIGLACEGSYRGIGVVVEYSGRVSEVVTGGPADRAGMRVGDRFLNDGMFIRDQYPLGHELVLRLERDGQRIDMPVLVGRVCYETAQSIPHLREHP